MAAEQMNAPKNSSAAVVKMLATAVLMIGIVTATCAEYRVYQRNDTAAEANIFASTFIRGSPVVQARLGNVENIKEIKELLLTGQRPGWYLGYDVTGRRANGVVDMRITPNPNYGSWNVPVAQLNAGQTSVALR